jgi:cation-transporting ATPase 13A1
MILSIAVNGSLMYLQSKKIFCTEPFRIPLAGQVSLLAFDKTGTLTVDQLKFKGIVQKDQLDKNDYQLTAIRSLDLGVQQVLAGCHSLLIQNRQVIGDPLEKLFF